MGKRHSENSREIPSLGRKFHVLFPKIFPCLVSFSYSSFTRRNMTYLDLAELLGLILYHLLKRAGNMGVQHTFPFTLRF